MESRRAIIIRVSIYSNRPLPLFRLCERHRNILYGFVRLIGKNDIPLIQKPEELPLGHSASACTTHEILLRVVGVRKELVDTNSVVVVAEACPNEVLCVSFLNAANHCSSNNRRP